MSRRTKRQKSQKAKQYKSARTEKGNKRKLPSLKETEEYIKKHNLKVINPLSDFGFKRLLASERNKDILIHLLNAFISEDTGIITDITYLPAELLGIREEDKYVRFDLYCKNQAGSRFIVEMQNGKQQHYIDRLRVYTSLATIHNWDKKDKYYKHVPHVYSFNLMSYNMQEFKERKRYFWKIYPKDDDNIILSKNSVCYFVELSKFAAQLETLDMSDERNRLLYMFTNVVYMPKKEIESLTPMQLRFYEECQITNFTDMEKQDYVKSLMEYEDVREMVECEREDAEQDGFERGMQQGVVQGRREILRRMLENGLAPEQVADLTGVAMAEIQNMMV